MNSQAIFIPLALLDNAAAIVGRTGSGKSYAAKGIVERMLDELRRVCIIDPTGAWWGLRLRNDGSEGFPVIIFGGDHADVPITDKSGEALGDIIANGDVPHSIIDLSDMSNAAQIRFLTDFFERLYEKNKKPLHLILDEADMMAPQNPLPETRRLQGVVNKIVRRGRIKGFRPLMITQRPQVIDKSVLSQVSTLIAMRLTSPQDRKALFEWARATGGAVDMVDYLPGLPVGTGAVWDSSAGTIEKMTFPKIRTFDSGRAPGLDEKQPEPRPLSSIDVSALCKALAIDAESKPNEKASAREIKAAEERGYERGYLIGARNEGDGYIAALRAVARDLTGTISAINAVIGEDAPAATITLTEPLLPEPKRAAVSKSPKPTSAPGLNSAGQKMLAVLDTDPPVRRSWTQVATLAGLKARGGHFNAGKKGLVESDLIEVDGDMVMIAKPSGNARTGKIGQSAIVEMWAKVLRGAAPKILRTIADSRTPISRESIATLLNMQPRGGHWNAAWKELRDNNLVEEAGSGGGWRLSSNIRGGA
jgi:hypothetical protein